MEYLEHEFCTLYLSVKLLYLCQHPSNSLSTLTNINRAETVTGMAEFAAKLNSYSKSGAYVTTFYGFPAQLMDKLQCCHVLRRI